MEEYIMNISCEPRNIRILPGNGSRLATASITIDDAFVVRNLSLMNGSKGMFVNMPQQKGVDEKGNTKYYDIAFPLTSELRTAISEAVIGAYKERLNELQNNAAHDDTPQSEANTSAADYEEDDVDERF